MSADKGTGINMPLESKKPTDTESKKPTNKQGILHALLPGARVDKNTKKIIVRVGTSRETVKFNVGGTVFETYKSTLRTIPKSPLANEKFLAKHFRPDKKDHFFDRDPEIFHCVLNYLRTGELHLPTSVCGPVVKSELEYWGVGEREIEECCWNRYSTWSSTLKALRKLEDDRKAAIQRENYCVRENPTPFDQFLSKIWKFFTDPTSSRAAKVYAYISLVIIFVSIFSFCAQTHKYFQVAVNETSETTVSKTTPNATSFYSTETVVEVTMFDDDMNSAATEEGSTETADTAANVMPHPALAYLDMACVIYFILELLCRFVVSPKKCRFVTKPMTIVEMMALIPDVIDNVVRLMSSSYVEYRRVMAIVEFLKVLRVFRIFRLMKHIPGLWILFYTLKSSVMDLLLLLLFVFVGMLVFSSLIYFAENKTQEDFSSIPRCFWWAVITMTTVGYGDMYPVTNWGYLIGTATSISGVLMIGFTVPVLVNNFIMYYNHTQATIRREKHPDKPSSGMANLHTLGSMTCFSSYDDFGLQDRLLGIGNYQMNAEYMDSNENEKAKSEGIVFSVSGDSRVKTSRNEASGIIDEEDNEGEETCQERMSHL